MTPGAMEDVMRGFKKALIERVHGAEMSHHLGYSPGDLLQRHGWRKLAPDKRHPQS
jgi:transposase-like protein